MKISILLVALIAMVCSSCSKPLVSAHVEKDVRYFSKSYAATPNDTYYAIRWALKETGHPVAEEDLPKGIITTAWVPTTSDSHFVEMFDRRDYGVTNSYYQLDIRVVDSSGRALVKVGSRVKTLVNKLKSSGEVENRLLVEIGNFLRKSTPDVTNLGVNE